MNTETYLITGATGDTGSKAVRLLLKKGHIVKALVHKNDERSAKLAEIGAQVVVGDLLDFDAVRAALHGVDGAYFVFPIAPGLIEATAYFAQAAKEAGVSHIVNMSQISSRAAKPKVMRRSIIGWRKRFSIGQVYLSLISTQHSSRSGSFITHRPLNKAS